MISAFDVAIRLGYWLLQLIVAWPMANDKGVLCKIAYPSLWYFSWSYANAKSTANTIWNFIF